MSSRASCPGPIGQRISTAAELEQCRHLASAEQWVPAINAGMTAEVLLARDDNCLARRLFKCAFGVTDAGEFGLEGE
jgi:hypothetical protein